MVGAVGEKGDVGAKSKSSLGFALPFADHAPANPIEVFAVATAASIALTNQFANAVFGMMQAAMSASSAAAMSGNGKSLSSEEKSPASDAIKVAADVDLVRAEADVEIASANAGKQLTSKNSGSRRRAVSVKQAAIKPAPLTTARSEAPAKPIDATVAPKSSVSRKKKRSDDLKKISGIGPKLEELLISMGVCRFGDIAGWSENEIEHFDRELALDGRIAKDDWIAQAKALLR